MHTFFINTSGSEIENYADILQIQHETRKLISLDCPLSKWDKEVVGYHDCVDRIGELIDSYKDINNDFNLIIYVDLIAVKEYAEISMSSHRERYACLRVMYSLLRNYMSATIIKELEDCGRTPKEVIVIFEENRRPEDGEERTDDGKRLIRLYLEKFVGLSDSEEIKGLVPDILGQDGVSDELRERAYKLFNSFVPGLSGTYKDLIDLFLNEIKERGSYEEPLEKLFFRIYDKGNRLENELPSVAFVTDRRAGVANKQERIRRDLRLSFYIFDCVESESVFEESVSDGNGEISFRVKEFPGIDWGKVSRKILKKSAEYKEVHQETLSLSDSFTEMELAPVLYEFDNEKFSLDGYGKRDVSLSIADDVDGPADGEEKDIGSAEKKTVVVSDKWTQNLFPEDDFKPFDYEGIGGRGAAFGGNTKAEVYIAEACKLREYHIQYLKKLKLDITDKLSNYAGRSLENVPALLKKRRVSLSDELYSASDRERHYTADPEMPETKKIDTVREISESSYESVVSDYLDFCAGRSVSVTDIEKQCDWFVTRISQIEKSLKRIKDIALSLFVAIMVMYIPFVVIQWGSIVSNLVSAFVALGSILAPMGILCLVLYITTYLQKKKCAEAYSEFVKKSNEVLEENILAAKKYDQLLSVFIPALRWVYEYKLDVDFYVECCRLAKAKINHHIQMLHGRIVTIRNIIDDLEINEEELETVEPEAKKVKLMNRVDYNASYCSGKKNKDFYSIISRDFLDAVKK